MKNLNIVLLIFTLLPLNCFSQKCNKFERWSDCRAAIKDYSTYLQPQRISIGINDTLNFNIVFEGNKDYVLSFCAKNLYYPIKVRMLTSDTKEELYNNAVDDYPNSIGFGFYRTQSLIIEISLIANKLGIYKEQCKDTVFIGMIMHCKRIFRII